MSLRFKFLIVLLFLLVASIASPFTYQIKTQVISLNTTAKKLPTTALVGREYIKIQNVGSVTAYIGNASVTADTASTGGIQLLPYATWQEDYDNTVDVYGIVATGTCNVTIEEGK